jgi:hypothetical protein
VINKQTRNEINKEEGIVEHGCEEEDGEEDVEKGEMFRKI